MAIYHFTVKVMSRSEGRNAVAGATYRHGVEMADSRTGQIFTNATHQDVEHCEISIPQNSPKWAKDLLQGDVHKNSEKLWNAVERFEKRIDAQVYREVEFALPQELNKEQRLVLAREFIQDNFTSKGMIADWCVHNYFDAEEGIEKPHVHVMLTMRALQEKEFSIVDSVKSALGISSSDIQFGQKVREWNSKTLVVAWREKWADYANTHLAKAGFDIRIDHRSYAEQGIELEPQPKLGKSVHEMSKRGQYVDRFSEMRAVQQKNQALIRKNPEIVLDYLSRYQSTFTRQDIAKVLNRYIDQVDEYQMLLAKIEVSPQLVTLSANEKGEALKLTTKDTIRIEKQLVTTGAELSSKPSHSPTLSSIDVALAKGHENLKEHGGLSDDQVHAIKHMVSGGQLKVIVGYAGAGKTTCLEIAKEIWESSNYKIVGAAPTGKAASNLENVGIASKTLHKWQQEWKFGREQLDNRSILILDEAGMVDSQRLHSLLTQSKEQGFKIVLVGDPEQLSPIEAGAPTRALMETVGFAELSTIVRQKTEWQREASRNLAIGQTEGALEAYSQNGTIHYKEDAKEQLIQDWIGHVRSGIKEAIVDSQKQAPSSLILAYTNQDVKELNTLARQEMHKEGLLDDCHYRFTISKPLNLETLDKPDTQDKAFKLKTIQEERIFAIGEIIVFLKNDYDLGVRNGQLGKITDIQEDIITVQKEDHSSLTFDIGSYNHLDYGYATTIHKSQGATVDNTFVYASPLMNKHLSYVALTRHKEDVQMYVDTNVIPTKDDLFKALSKDAPKENALDHSLDKDQLMDISHADQRAFMLRRSISSVASYITWDSIKEFTYKAWSQAKDWMFGDVSPLYKEANTVKDLEPVTSSPTPSALESLHKVSLSENQLQTIKEVTRKYGFDIPETLQETQFNQLVGHTQSYLKSMELKEVDRSREQELVTKACYIQCHLEKVTNYHNKEDQQWSSEKVFTITAMAANLWYQGREGTSYAFEQSCIPKAVGQYKKNEGLFPQLIEAYQKIFNHLPDSQITSLAESVIKVFQISGQLPTREQLQDSVKILTQDPGANTPDRPLSKTSEEKEKLAENPILQCLDRPTLAPSFEKTISQVVEQYRKDHQLEKEAQMQLQIVHQLER